MAFVCAGFNVLLGAVEMVFVANGVLAFLFAWELMTLATAALVASDHEIRATRRAAYLYLVMSHVGTGCLVAAFLVLTAKAGSASFPALLAGHLVSGPLRTGLFALFFVGFGVKAGIIPLHVWLPEAHPAAPSSISALMSAVLITAGIYGLFRFCAFGLGVPTLRWGLTFMAAGTLSAILGVLYALTQSDVKRLLAYSTIENAGIIVLGLGAAMVALAFDHGELATIAVSPDGEEWFEYPCTATAAPYGACSGARVVYANPGANDIDPTDPLLAGGDPYDLADLGLSEARYVRVTDRADLEGAAGVYDLDAVAIVNPSCP